MEQVGNLTPKKGWENPPFFYPMGEDGLSLLD